MNAKELNSGKWVNVLRPLILKRDAYKCQVCGIKQGQVVYVNSSGVYVVCDEFIQEWARSLGKKVFKLSLNVICLSGQTYSEDSTDLITFCPRHAQLYQNAYYSEFRIKIRAKIKQQITKGDPELNFIKSSALPRIIKDIRRFTGVSVTALEAESLFSNIIKKFKDE